MNIGINCLKIKPAYVGGVNTYTLGLLEGFLQEGSDHRFQIYIHKANRQLFKAFTKYPNAELVDCPLFGPWTYRLSLLPIFSFSTDFFKWANNTMFGPITRLMDKRSDLIYFPATTLLPYNNTRPTVLSIHDIQQVHFPHYFPWFVRLYRRITSDLSVRCADYIQASSEFIKHDLLSHFTNLREDQVFFIPEGVNIDEFKAPVDLDQVLAPYRLPERFLFFPGQLWLHKNHITVLKALKQIRQQHEVEIPLVMTGAEYSGARGIFKYMAQHQMDFVHYLGKVPFAVIVALYQKARFHITAVLYESSSLPILEAAASGTPIIASKIPPNVEMSRILALNLFEPTDEESLASLLMDLWRNDDLIGEQVEHNNRAIEHYSWRNAARTYLAQFETILERGERVDLSSGPRAHDQVQR